MQRTNRIARLVVAALAAFVLFLVAAIAYLQFSATRQSAELQARRGAHVVATQFGWMFQASAQALQRIEDLAANTSLDSATPRSISNVVQGLPSGLQQSLYDAAGRLVLSSVPDASAIDVSDRPYFKRVRAGEELVISPMITERLTGAQVFVMARRVDRNGSFAGAATIAIPVSKLAEFASEIGPDEGLAVSLVGTDGMLIARYPPVEPTDLSGTQLFTELKTRPDGVYSAVSQIDGVRRIGGYWKLDDWPVVAVVALSERGVFGSLRDRVATGALVLLPVVAGMTAMLVWIFRMQARDARREGALRSEIERNSFLMKEIHHRVKNNLQTVMSLVRLAPLPDDAKTALVGRISAMAGVHQEMFCSDDRETVAARPYLNQLVKNIAKSYGKDVAVTVAVAPVDLPNAPAMHIGLLVNEIVSNAFKHAYNGRARGRLDVELSETAPGWLRLRVSDDGPGMDQAGSGHMGSRLIAAFVDQLGGRLDMESDGGLHVTVDFPADMPAETDAA